MFSFKGILEDHHKCESVDLNIYQLYIFFNKDRQIKRNFLKRGSCHNDFPLPHAVTNCSGDR